MATIQSPQKKAMNASNYDSVFIWWYQPWMTTNSSAAKLQHIWLDILNDTLRHEFELLSTMAESYSKLTSCLLGLEGVHSPLSMALCYHKVASEMAGANMKQILKITEFNEEFKERIWCEI